MMRNLNEIKVAAEHLSREINKFLKDSGYEYLGELECEYDTSDAEQIYQYKRLSNFCDHVNVVKEFVDGIGRKVIDSGTLHLNKNGRYELNGHEFTCGSSLEYLAEDDYNDVPYWRESSIEAKDGQYYLVVSPHTKMEGLQVRRKE